MVKDFLGNELNVGDEVTYFSQQWGVFKRGKIISFSPKMLLININNNHKKTLRQFHNQVIKIESKSENQYITPNYVCNDILNLNKDSLDK